MREHWIRKDLKRIKEKSYMMSFKKYICIFYPKILDPLLSFTVNSKFLLDSTLDFEPNKSLDKCIIQSYFRRKKNVIVTIDLSMTWGFNSIFLKS